MASFRFKLQQVLDYRSQLEEQARLHFARAQHEYEQQERHVAKVRETLAEYQRKLYECPRGSQHDYWLLENYVKSLNVDLSSALQSLNLLTQVREGARTELVQRAQERKLLEQLKAKQAERHAKEEKLSEQRTYDETATLRFRPPSF